VYVGHHAGQEQSQHQIQYRLLLLLLLLQPIIIKSCTSQQLRSE
jgi:hypothetical protein